MKILRYLTGIVLLLVIAAGGSFFYAWNKAQYGKGSATEPVSYVLEKGTGARDIGRDLAEKKVIFGEKYFVFYLWKSDRFRELKAGTYFIPAGLTIPEIVDILAGGETESIQTKVTIPEGWSIKDIAKRLSNNELPGTEFEKIASKPPVDLLAEYVFLADLPKGESLEGYLFPDTYFFAKNATGREIVETMLQNFDQKYSSTLREQVKAQGKTAHQIVTMASIVEGEVPTQADRKIVSGIFWKRIEIGQPLQSCATLAFILGEYKKQYSIEETQTPSPYNTYRNGGLPPGPINNPGISAISAAITPEETGYLYFLSNNEKQTIFSRTFEEHVANKAKYGL